MCPLRVFLILFSAIIALIAALITFRDVWFPSKKGASNKPTTPQRVRDASAFASSAVCVSESLGVASSERVVDTDRGAPIGSGWMLHSRMETKCCFDRVSVVCP
jgi:hypothetical protein